MRYHSALERQGGAQSRAVSLWQDDSLVKMSARGGVFHMSSQKETPRHSQNVLEILHLPPICERPLCPPRGTGGSGGGEDGVLRMLPRCRSAIASKTVPISQNLFFLSRRFLSLSLSLFFSHTTHFAVGLYFIAMLLLILSNSHSSCVCKSDVWKDGRRAGAKRCFLIFS